MTEPIKPSEVTRALVDVPDFVIESFNELIQEEWNGSASKFTQDEVIEKIVSRGNITRYEIFEKGYLNVENFYRGAGWKVFYDKPAYSETYKAIFKFSK